MQIIKLTKPFLITTLSVMLIFLSGCGGSGGNNESATAPPSSAAAPTLNENAVKIFQFAWTDIADATFYKILENPDGISGFTQVGNDVQQGTEVFKHSVPLYARLNARYILQSCNAAGCLDSSTLVVSGSLRNAIGYFKAASVTDNDLFGYSVDLSGDGNTLAVGVIEAVNSAQAGAVYIFSRNSDTLLWTEQEYLNASNADDGDLFGNTVALSDDGNTLAVGAEQESSNASIINGDESNNLSSNSGAAYVFVRDGNSLSWTQQAYIKASNSGADDYFGSALALSGDGSTLAVSAMREDSNATDINGSGVDNSTPSSGAAYVYVRSGLNWTEQAYIKASNTDIDDRFGSAISISKDGNTLAISAEREDSAAMGINVNQGNLSGNTNFNAGAVYIFKRSVTSWSQQTYIKANNTDKDDEFGNAIALSGDGNTLAIGVKLEDSNATGINGDDSDNSVSDSGAVYVFTQMGNSWSQQAYIKADNPEASDNFGNSLTLSENGNTLAVSAYLEDSSNLAVNFTAASASSNNNKNNSGAVYVFKRANTSWQTEAYLKASNSDVDDLFGYAISLTNDGNTLAVSAPYEDSSADTIGGHQNNETTNNAGAVYLY